MVGQLAGSFSPGLGEVSILSRWDIQAGRLSPETALGLIEALYLLINEFVPDGLAVAVMVGGRDAAGNDLTKVWQRPARSGCPGGPGGGLRARGVRAVLHGAGSQRLRAGAFCWIMYERLGRECGATPDGRRAGFPFADGCGPAQGREQAGPTAAVLSVTSWDAAPLIGGSAFNMKFGASLFNTPGASQRLRDLVLTFLQLGGFETQINVVDGWILREAQANPEAYRDLVVRIGGYTDYFTHLSPQMQAELILRTEYAEI